MLLWQAGTEARRPRILPIDRAACARSGFVVPAVGQRVVRGASGFERAAPRVAMARTATDVVIPAIPG